MLPDKYKRVHDTTFGKTSLVYQKAKDIAKDMGHEIDPIHFIIASLTLRDFFETAEQLESRGITREEAKRAARRSLKPYDPQGDVWTPASLRMFDLLPKFAEKARDSHWIFEEDICNAAMFSGSVAIRELLKGKSWVEWRPSH